MTHSSLSIDSPTLPRKWNPRTQPKDNWTGWGYVLLLFALLLVLLAANLAFSQGSAMPNDGGSRKFSPDLARNVQENSDAPMRVIVQYKNAYANTHQGRPDGGGKVPLAPGTGQRGRVHDDACGPEDDGAGS